MHSIESMDENDKKDPSDPITDAVKTSNNRIRLAGISDPDV